MRLAYREVAEREDAPTGALRLVPNPVVTLFEPGTTTPLDQTIYADRSSGTTLPNPFTGAIDGTFEFWLEEPQAVDVRVDGASAGVGVYTLEFQSPRYEEGFMKVSGTGSRLDLTNASGGATLKAIKADGTAGVLSLQSAPGTTVRIDQQSGYTSAQVFGLEVIKKFHDTGSVFGSANATFNQITYDGSGATGTDPTTVKVTQHWTGTGTDPTTTARCIEVEAIRYAATAPTGAASAIGVATPSVAGSTRGIDIAIAIDPLIVAPILQHFDATPLHLYADGAASTDGRTFTGGRKGSAFISMHGAVGCTYGIVYNGPSAPNQDLNDLTGRIFHIREAGGLGGLFYQTSSTEGTGLRLAAQGGGGRNIDISASGSAIGAPHTGKLSLVDTTSGVYIADFGMNAADTTKGQFSVIDGTAAFPGFAFYADLDTGFYRIGANQFAAVAGTNKVMDIANGQVGFQNGSAGTPSIGFYADPDNGAYLIGTNNWGLAAGATKAVDISASQVGVLDGTAGTPGLGFYGDPDNGLYRIGTNNWALTAGGNKVVDLAAGQAGFPDGSVGAPGVGFHGDPNNGLYRIGTDNWGLSAGGAKVFDLIATQARVIGGNDAGPGLAGYGDIDTGFVWAGSDVLGVSIGGTRRGTWTSTGLGIGATPSALLHLNGPSALRIDNSANWATTVGAAGGASAQPATPLGYLIVNLGGVNVKVAYHNV